ncbi:MAG: hypothetical protein WC516_02670 [Patescibacteria group bacterium]
MGRYKTVAVFFVAIAILALGVASPAWAGTFTSSQAESFFESILGGSRAREIRNYRGTIIDFIEDSGNLTTSTLYSLKVDTTTPRFAKLQTIKGAFVGADPSATFALKAKTKIINAIKGSMADMCNADYTKAASLIRKNYSKALADQTKILNAVKTSSTQQYNNSTLPLRKMRDSLERFYSFELYKQVRDAAITEGYRNYYANLPPIIAALNASSTVASTTLGSCLSSANN